MSHEIDRRELLRRAGTAAAGVSALSLAGCAESGAEQIETVARTAASIRRRVPQVKKGEAPNLLLVVIDSIRADHLGSYGRRNAHTPNLDALARESLRFTSVYPEAFPTGPARASIYGGARVFPFADWTAPPPDMPKTPGWQAVPDHNLVSTLRRAGYFTAMTADTPWVLVGSQKPFQRDFHRFVPIPGQTGTITQPASLIDDATLARHVAPKIVASSSGSKMRQYLANQVGRTREQDYLPAKVFTEATRLLEECNGQKKPWLLIADCFDPHEPWDPPDKYVELHGGSLTRAWDPGTVLNGTSAVNGLGRADIAQMKALYRAELTMADHWFGNFMQRFNELDLERETLVVFLSDHGFLLGERGYVAKMATQCYPELIHVPMLMRHPEGRGARKTTDYFTQTQDVASTMLAAAGVRKPGFMDGVNLLPLTEGRKGRLRMRKRSYVTGAYSSIVFARDRRWSYMSDNQNKTPRLYDTSRDRREVRNVAPGNPTQVRKMYQGMVVRDNGGAPLPKFT